MNLAQLLADLSGPGPMRPAKKKVKAKKKPFGAPLTPRDARREVNAQANLRYGGQYGALGEQFRALGQQEQTVPLSYANFRAELAGRLAQQKATYDAAVQQAQTQGQTQQQATTNQIGQLQQQSQADAASRGATVSGQPFADAALAAGHQGSLQQALATLIQGQGLQGQAYGQNMGDVAGLYQNQALTQIAQDRMGLMRQGQALDAEQGAFKTGLYGDLREAERRYGLERKAFGLDVQRFKESTKPKPVDPLDAWGYGDSDNDSVPNAKDPTPLRPGTQKPRGMTPGQKRAAKEREAKRIAAIREKSGEAESTVEEIRAHLRDPKAPDNARERLLTGDNPLKKTYPKALVDVAAALNAGKRLTPEQIKALHRLGIRVPRKWIRSKNEQRIRDNEVAGPPNPAAY